MASRTGEPTRSGLRRGRGPGRRGVTARRPRPLLPEAAWPAGLGDGWRAVLVELRGALEGLDPRCGIHRVELDGPLRVAVSAPPELRERAEALRAAAEARAARTCETCGGPGRVRSGAGLVVLCDDCVEHA